MNKNHKHYQTAKAWLEGAEIEYKKPQTDEWHLTVDPGWFEEYEYRVKPEPEPKWYENIPESGVLCWVSDVDPNPSRNNQLDIIISKQDDCFTTKTEFPYQWNYANPLTPDEIKQFLKAAEAIA